VEHRVLVASKSFGYGARPETLMDLFRTYSLKPTFASLEDCIKIICEFEGMIIGTSKVSRDLLIKARQLLAIVKYGVGIDNIDIEAARELGIKVQNLPGINAQAVAEMALGLMLSVARQIAKGDRSIRSASWEGSIGSSVAGKTLGVIGTGAIGCSLVKLVSGMEMKILGYDIIKNPDFLACGGEYVELDSLLSTSDYVSLHLTLNPYTFHFIDRQKLSQMKQSAFLINTSRGKVIDEQALINALENGVLAGAALDVLESEPPSSQALLMLENVVLTPHIGAYTHETLRRMDEICVSTLSSAIISSQNKEIVP
jgi:phosphoglycerate dehydrogenase-like enzyme